MAAVKPMIQQPGGAKPNSSYNNNNGRTASSSMQQEQSITQVRGREKGNAQHVVAYNQYINTKLP